ncbi:hypothetical protein [Caldovatus aquaticus]|uniref:Uncharacterized protein n=1 Tax=Caldovatus aquaticus TaxID=2865671 RepID=A0ABS7F0P2_9PROT|nr:hypothetical protein [Caldovatus aquaticus]MBW8268371.1 hypothetical protein [Caldovatus aquaticus]
MAWLWKNTLLAAALSAIAALVLLALDQGTLASFALMLLGMFLMMQAEIGRAET